MRDPQLESPIELAQRLGTLNKADRSAQYQDASLPALLRSHNKQWEEFRRMQNRRLRDAILVAAITALLTYAPQLISWLVWFTGN